MSNQQSTLESIDLGAPPMVRMRQEWHLLGALALPMLAGSLSDITLNLADTAIVGRLGVKQLAAVGTAAAVYSVISQILAASVIGYQITAARRFGSGDRSGVRVALSHAIPVLLSLATLGVILLWLSYPIVNTIARDPQVSALALVFLRYRSFGLLFGISAFLLRTTFDTDRQTRWGMYASLGANALNIPLSYALAFGAGPFPRMGVGGSGLASSIATAISFLFLAIIFAKRRPVAPTTSRRGWEQEEVRNLLRLSGPEMVNAALDYAGNLVFVFIAGLLGVGALAGSRIAYILLLIFFTISMTLGVGVQILAGRAWGRSNLVEVKFHLMEGRLLALGVVSSLGIACALGARELVWLFNLSGQIAESAASAIRVVGLSAPLMVWTACHVGIIRALGHTKWVMYTNVGAVWLIQLPAAWVLGVWLHLGLIGLYLGYGAYFLARAVVSNYLAGRLIVHAGEREGEVVRERVALS